MPKAMCSIEGCGAERIARGWCDRHYRRYRRTGSPTTPPRKPSQRHFTETILERFWAHVYIDPRPGACWVWIPSAASGDYGRFRIGRGKKVKAPRFSLEISTRSPVPEGMWVLHHCDNPPCVRPDHLFIGTVVENSADMVSKGRGRGKSQNGEANDMAKLTEAKVLAILSAPSTVSASTLAAEYGVSRALIGMVRTRKVWRHVEGPTPAHRGYGSSGAANPAAKLTEADVRLIRASPGRPRAELAAQFGITASTVSQIRGGRTWTQCV